MYQNVAMTSCYSLKTLGHWVQSSETKGHYADYHCESVLARETPTTMMKSDRMVSSYSYNHSFIFIIPKKA